jgi:hypothetical protein
MPAGNAVPTFERTWLAPVLTCQVFVGAFLHRSAVRFGNRRHLLDTARAVAKFDLPMRVLGLWWGNPQ